MDGPYAGRTPAEVRAALRSAGVDEAAANEEMARAFNDCEAAGMPLMAVQHGPHGPDDAFRLEPTCTEGDGERTTAEPRNEEATGATCDLAITGASADLGDRLARAAEAGGLDSAAAGTAESTRNSQKQWNRSRARSS